MATPLVRLGPVHVVRLGPRHVVRIGPRHVVSLGPRHVVRLGPVHVVSLGPRRKYPNPAPVLGPTGHDQRLHKPSDPIPAPLLRPAGHDYGLHKLTPIIMCSRCGHFMEMDVARLPGVSDSDAIRRRQIGIIKCGDLVTIALAIADTEEGTG